MATKKVKKMALGGLGNLGSMAAKAAAAKPSPAAQGPSPQTMKALAGLGAQMQGQGPVPPQVQARANMGAQMQGQGPVPPQVQARANMGAQMQGQMPQVQPARPGGMPSAANTAAGKAMLAGIRGGQNNAVMAKKGGEVKKAKGGSVRGCGCATKGLTKGRMV